MDEQLQAALNQALDGIKYDVLRQRIADLSARYRGECVRDGAASMADRLDCLAYAVFRMPATFRALRAALTAADAHVGSFSNHLDLGGGTGAGAWAAADVWPGISTEIVERQPDAIELGSTLLANGNQQWTRADLRRWEPERRVELVTISYVLGELTAATRGRVVAKAANTADTVVVVEPGTPRGFERILEARRQLIDLGMTFAAPCPHEQACPLAANDWCHFAVRVPRSELHRLAKHGTRNYEDEKFSYLVATRRPSTSATNRIINRPTRPKGRVVLDLCTADGTRKQLVVPKSSEQFRSARDATWGDSWEAGRRS
ncbi:small ribosomal subunit Rsm22 family protein [Kribbella sp. CA-247076]|uniref:small ribosomal subunit Rsm22 family protein n=1 Tax=Kribbella sp. CA-247076 TaxID=3239941 RepID=UPI003D8D9EE9